MSYTLQNSTRKDKKYMVITPTNKKIHFGAAGYSDYNEHKNEQRKLLYINRHKKNENWEDASTAGFWARWILWGEYTNITKNINYIKNKFGLKIINNIL